MPADEFDAFDEQSIPAPPPATDDDPWGFDEQPAPPPKKETTTKKKKKAKKDARKIRVEDGEDSSAYPKSITPSPPTDHGAKLQPTITDPSSQTQPPRVQPVATSSPLVDLIDDVTTAVEDVDALPPAPPPPPSKSTSRSAPSPSPAASPVMASPRPIAARPNPPVSPPSRPVSMYNAPFRDRNNSSIGFRPTVSNNIYHVQPRRESATVQRPRFVEPPPPHMPQAHFFGLPDLGFKFGQKQEAGSPAGSDGYCCRIDSLADAGDDVSAKKAKDALLVGSEGGLEVFRILPNKLEVVGRLEGLRGSIIDAKILPHNDVVDELQALRPLVAVIVHGPVIGDRTDSGAEGGNREAGNGEPPKHFQTSVEVYSLKSSLFVATIYRSSKIAIEFPAVGQVSSFPQPIGDFRLDARGEYVTLSSGKSGEIFVFTQSAAYTGLDETRFRCIGKFWTTIQKANSATSRPQSAGDPASDSANIREEPRNALYSLSRRWLAIVPPAGSSKISIQGSPLMSEINPTPPGVISHAAPAPPIITCDVVGTDVEGVWSRLGRQAAQGLMKYSQKGIEMGLQGWKELTQPSPPNGGSGHDHSTNKDDLFPPTKGPTDDPHRLARDPALVSIIDLDSLKHYEEVKAKHPPSALATFALTEGCNFLSLSSIGTRMVSVSRKGQLSTIWDLTQVAHGIAQRGAVLDDASSSQCIEQLQRIVRNSPSVVLDCAWSKDDDALAILTAHGTIHLHGVPSRPPIRKRKRAGTGNTPAVEKADATVSLQSGASPPSTDGGFLGSIKSSWQSVSTQVNSIRSTNAAAALGLPITFAGFREVTAAASNAGGRAVARGLSQGYTAAKGGASDYWHADDNKIRHTKALQEPLSAKSIRWIRRNNTTSVAIACGGSVHIHPVQRATRRKGNAVVTGLKHERYAQKSFPLPHIATRNGVGASKALAESCLDQGPHGFWSLRHSSPAASTGIKPSWQVEGTQASDVETNPPYCPFHIDSTVNIYAYEENHDGSQSRLLATIFDVFQSKGHEMHEDPWTFGETLPCSTRVNEAVPDDDDLDAGYDDDEHEGNAGLASQMESKLTIQPAHRSHGGEQIRINTRRRQGRGKAGSGAGDGDFEMTGDDDDSII